MRVRFSSPEEVLLDWYFSRFAYFQQSGRRPFEVGGANGRFSFIKSHTRTDLTLSYIRFVLERNCGWGLELQPAGNQLQLPAAELNCFSFVTKSTKPKWGLFAGERKNIYFVCWNKPDISLDFLGWTVQQFWNPNPWILLFLIPCSLLKKLPIFCKGEIVQYLLWRNCLVFV